MIRCLVITAAMVLAPATALVAQATSPASYVMMAGAGDQYEIQSSRLLLTTTTNPKLRSFANMMIADHSKSTTDVKAAAMKDGLRPAPPKLDTKGSADLAALRATRGTARDQLYVTQQKAAHAKALALHQGYASGGSAAALKVVADATAPMVEHHLGQLNAM